MREKEKNDIYVQLKESQNKSSKKRQSRQRKSIKKRNKTVWVNDSPAHVIFVYVIFLDSGYFPSFFKFLQSKITCITLGVSAISLFL